MTNCEYIYALIEMESDPTYHEQVKQGIEKQLTRFDVVCLVIVFH